MTGQPHYPYRSGERAVLGPEVFASADGMTISWQGARYRRDHGPETAEASVVPTLFVLWLDASDGSVPTHDGVRWPDGTATVHHRHFGYTTTHTDPEAARQAAHGKQGRIAWPAPDAALQPPARDGGPTVREAAAQDRRWPLEKEGL